MNTKQQISISLGVGGIEPGAPLKSALNPVPDGVIGAEFGGRLLGLDDPVTESGDYRLLTLDEPRGLELLWHSASHLLAQAVLRLYPHAKLGIGPAIRDGFYYDFDFGEPISSDELSKIEDEMRREVDADYPIERREVTTDEAKRLFEAKGQTYKLELIEGLDGRISTYSQGEFTDLCRGPHIPSTGLIKHFKLLSLTGAYWRGDERNPMLQRIYGTAYPTAEQLDAHLKRIEEAKRRDHRLLGRQLDLFTFLPEAPGAPFWLDKGTQLFNGIQEYLRKVLRRRGYVEVRTPLILARELWERSGHWDHYKANMYFTSQEDRDYAVKPMNCPGAVLMFKERQWSYRDLPLRWAELGTVHRYEKSGTLHGLFRVRHITQDDAHIFCTPDQMVAEIADCVKLVFEVYGKFGMTDMAIELSTRPKDRIGTDDQWDKAEAALAKALDELGVFYEVNEGEGAFYGPKIDFHILDSLGRSWQLSTVQLDFNFPERFELEFIGADNTPHRPAMIHRAIFGSLERFLGILIEHYGGDFPLWLSPEQAVILPITDAQIPFGKQVLDKMAEAGLRCRLNDRNEKIGKKIRDAELKKVPYMLVIGAREADSGQVSLRHRGEGDLGAMSIEKVLSRLIQEAAN